ncbi:hypothetical protein HH310_16530 [Actinoplanes sp. TBRC 11911]|uniref:maleylpyruvate isomerase N-terminal domain-containing protein n=1 Tax=Actinoplanes sp. TBRC 11911 TaxID=2729386 RepID=UPI00145D17B3|nr:maleylpyruvate isomerase N-terminal domain-containing protein [Actinoplanes sp. TBRC 11911]NMO52793.1 hypothetical protein [Actinoplanes sp. TBRC 11911]
MDYRRTFRSSAVSFVDLVSRVPDDRWAEPGLRELAGQTVSSALGQVPVVLAEPAAEIVVDAPEAYFAGGVPAVTAMQDVRLAGELAGRATQALAAAGDDDVVTTPAGGMRVRDWIPTRTLELVVHGMDVARAAGLEVAFAAEAIEEVALVAARAAVRGGDAAVLLRALTGRGSLPSSYSVL